MTVLAPYSVLSIEENGDFPIATLASCHVPLNLAQQPTSPPSSNKENTALMVGVGGLALVVIVSLALIFLQRRQRQNPVEPPVEHTSLSASGTPVHSSQELQENQPAPASVQSPTEALKKPEESAPDEKPATDGDRSPSQAPPIHSQQAPEKPEPPAEPDERADLRLGLDFAEVGRFAEAIKHINQFLEHCPNDTQGILGRGLILLKIEHLDEALKHFQAVLQVEPENIEGLMGQGRVLARQGQFQEALSAFDRVIALQPDLIDAWAARGLVLMNLGRFSEGQAAHRKALELQQGP